MARDLVLEVVEQVRGNALGDAARDLDQLAKKTDTAAGSARDYSSNLKQLDAQIEKTRATVRALGLEFVATQEKTVAKDLRTERGLLRQLERIRKELSDAGTAAADGFHFTFLKNIGALPSQARGLLMVGVVAAAAAAAPAIGASVAGAVVGTVGAGGIAGGIAAASRDPGVRAAAADFGKTVSDEFFRGGQAFVEPTIDSLAILQDAFDDLDLGDSWERVAPYVTRVAEGVAGLAERFMPGFNRALDAAGPGLELLAQELPQLGAVLGDMVGDIAESEGALEGLLFVFNLVEGTITAVGNTITWLSNRFDDLVTLGIEITDVLEELPIFWLQELAGIDMSELNDGLERMRNRANAAETGLTGLTDAGRSTTAGLYSQEAAAKQLADAVDRLTKEYTAFLGVQLDQDQANQRVAESMLRLKETLADNGKDWRENTKAGQENRAMLTSAVAALIQQRQANIDAGMSADEATAKFQAQLGVLEQLAVKAGISKAALQDLVGDYYVRVNVSTTGDAAYRAAIARALAGNDRISGFAAGGDPPIGEPFWVGEGGRELMVLSPRPHVYSAQQSQAIAAGGNTAAARQTALLEQILVALQHLPRPQQTFNINAPEGTSPRETAAVVARELAWNS